MKRSSRLIVVLALAAAVTAPLATLHPIAMHLLHAGESGLSHELRDGALLALFVVFGASLAPLANMGKIVMTWTRQVSLLTALRASSEMVVEGDGVTYWFFPAQDVHFFTAGVVRPRIYASSGAREHLDDGAFRAAILHEQEHQRGHHVRWRFALAALEAAFRPVAPVRRAIGALALECEFAADRAALAAGAERGHLFDAVVAASRSPGAGYTVGLSGTGILQRLEALTSGTSERRASVRPLAWLVAGLSGLPVVAHALFWFGAICL